MLGLVDVSGSWSFEDMVATPLEYLSSIHELNVDPFELKSCIKRPEALQSGTSGSMVRLLRFVGQLGAVDALGRDQLVPVRSVEDVLFMGQAFLGAGRFGFRPDSGVGWRVILIHKRSRRRAGPSRVNRDCGRASGSA